MTRNDNGTITVNADELDQLTDAKDCVHVSTVEWSKGRIEVFKVEVDGKPFIARLPIHAYEGWQIGGGLTLVPAKLETRQVWVEA